ncbi:MAG: hypothetical protein C0490_26970 [Marivirga sp.]|nr:hypothetical protein [Marivirga sp.]
MERKFQSIGHSGNKKITKPEALVFVDNTGSYYAGELLTDPEVEQLRNTHKVSEIIWEGRQRYARAARGI